MNDNQTTLKNMVIAMIAKIDPLDEDTIETSVDTVCRLPMFAMLSKDEIDEVKAAIKSDFSIKLDTGVLIQEKGHVKTNLTKHIADSLLFFAFPFARKHPNYTTQAFRLNQQILRYHGNGGCSGVSPDFPDQRRNPYSVVACGSFCNATA